MGDPRGAKAGGELRAGVVFPQTYRAGMASLGYQLVWGMFAAHEAFTTERYFAAPAGRPPAGIVPAPRGLERGTPLAQQDVIAFSAYYEPDYLRVYGMLAGAGIRPWTAERGEFDPFVIIGGPAVTANPEPLAPFADAVIRGDAEGLLPRVLDTLAAHWGGARADVGKALAAIPGVYVPALYSAVLGIPGAPPRFVPREGIPALTPRHREVDLSAHRPISWIAAARAEFGKLVLLEPIRGCGRGCRFCATAALTRPPRRRPLASLRPYLDELPPSLKRIGLVGAALADYPEVDDLAADLLARGFEISVSSLALAAAGTKTLIRALGASGHRSVALAPEAATAAGREQLGKPLPNGRLEEVLEEAGAAGLSKIKLYYLIGYPGEDAGEASALGEQLAALKRRFRRLTFDVRVNPVVPKAGTAFENAVLIARGDYNARLKAIRNRAGGMAVTGGSWREADLQARLGRGDRAAARWIAAAAERSIRDTDFPATG